MRWRRCRRWSRRRCRGVSWGRRWRRCGFRCRRRCWRGRYWRRRRCSSRRRGVCRCGCRGVSRGRLWRGCSCSFRRRRWRSRGSRGRGVSRRWRGCGGRHVGRIVDDVDVFAEVAVLLEVSSSSKSAGEVTVILAYNVLFLRVGMLGKIPANISHSGTPGRLYIRKSMRSRRCHRSVVSIVAPLYRPRPLPPLWRRLCNCGYQRESNSRLSRRPCNPGDFELTSRICPPNPVSQFPRHRYQCTPLAPPPTPARHRARARRRRPAAEPTAPAG